MSDLTGTLAAWKAITENAHRGPWVIHRFGRSTRVGIDYSSAPTDLTGSLSEGDAEFIALSRTIVPALLSAVESVLALHTPYDTGRLAANGHDFAEEYQECTACEERWPCPTVKALTDALGGA